MTLEFYKAEEARLLEALSKTKPASEDYKAILNNLEGLAIHTIRTIDVEERLRYNDETAVADGFATTPNGTVLRVVQSKPIEPDEIESTATPVAPSEPEPEPEPVPADEPKLTLDDVKTAFTAAARSGVKVAEIIADTGYARLSDVPAELYGALMRALERKQNGEE